MAAERCTLPPREETLVVNVVCWHVLLTQTFSAGQWSTLILYHKTTRPKHPTITAEPAGPDRTPRSLNRKHNRWNNERLRPGTPQPPAARRHTSTENSQELFQGHMVHHVPIKSPPISQLIKYEWIFNHYLIWDFMTINKYSGLIFSLGILF